MAPQNVPRGKLSVRSILLQWQGLRLRNRNSVREQRRELGGKYTTYPWTTFKRAQLPCGIVQNWDTSQTKNDTRKNNHSSIYLGSDAMYALVQTDHIVPFSLFCSPVTNHEFLGRLVKLLRRRSQHRSRLLLNGLLTSSLAYSINSPGRALLCLP